MPVGVAYAKMGVGAVTEDICTTDLLCRGEEATILIERREKGRFLIHHSRPLPQRPIERFFWKCGCQPITVFLANNIQFGLLQQFPKNDIAECFEEVQLVLVESGCLICHSKPFSL